MSPLVRSLLALAALLASATAGTTQKVYSDSPCTTIKFGQVNPEDSALPTQHAFVPPRKGTITVKSTCPLGSDEDGEEVRACNNDPYGQPPQVGLEDNDLSYVEVECIDDSCPDGVDVDIVVYCTTVLPPTTEQSTITG